MKIIAYFRAIILCITILLSSACSDSVDFYLLDGNAKQMQDYRGKWLIINFWAEWCSPCREEIPELNQMYKSQKNKSFELIGVSYEPLSNQKITEIVNEWGILYPVMATSPMPILPFKRPISLPGNYIFNPEGKLVLRLSGKQTKESLTKLLKSLKIKSGQTH